MAETENTDQNGICEDDRRWFEAFFAGRSDDEIRRIMQTIEALDAYYRAAPVHKYPPANSFFKNSQKAIIH